MDPKETLRLYLQRARDTLVDKTSGLSERELRLPRTPTGTNLLGVVKHVALVEAGYLGTCLGREPADIDFTDLMSPDAPDNADLYARPDESADDVFALYRRAWRHDDASIEALPLEAEARVPWWGEERNPVTLHTLLVHVIAETNRHAGQLDILREGVDGAVGYLGAGDTLPEHDAAWWSAQHRMLTEIADSFG